MKTSLFAIATVLVIGLASTTVATSARAEIYLESNEFSNICGLEVSVGPDAPNATVQQFGDIEPPWRQEYDGAKVCFRFSNPPDTCGSWTDWKCCESSGGATLCAID